MTVSTQHPNKKGKDQYNWFETLPLRSPTCVLHLGQIIHSRSNSCPTHPTLSCIIYIRSDSCQSWCAWINSEVVERTKALEGLQSSCCPTNNYYLTVASLCANPLNTLPSQPLTEHLPVPRWIRPQRTLISSQRLSVSAIKGSTAQHTTTRGYALLSFVSKQHDGKLEESLLTCLGPYLLNYN